VIKSKRVVLKKNKLKYCTGTRFLFIAVMVVFVFFRVFRECFSWVSCWISEKALKSKISKSKISKYHGTAYTMTILIKESNHGSRVM